MAAPSATALLTELPRKFRQIRSCSTQTGHCRGFGFVDLEKPLEALADFQAGIVVDKPIDFTARLDSCCGGKVDLLFPFVPSGIRAKLQLDSTALPPLQTALFSTMEEIGDSSAESRCGMRTFRGFRTMGATLKVCETKEPPEL